jgi:hypothetical protein
MNSPQALAEYARSTDVWVCASETLGLRWPFKDFLEKDALHVAMVVYPMEGPGVGVELQPAVFKRQDLTVRRTPA